MVDDSDFDFFDMDFVPPWDKSTFFRFSTLRLSRIPPRRFRAPDGNGSLFRGTPRGAGFAATEGSRATRPTAPRFGGKAKAYSRKCAPLKKFLMVNPFQS
jgi:hypothetical protein